MLLFAGFKSAAIRQMSRHSGLSLLASVINTYKEYDQDVDKKNLIPPPCPSPPAAIERAAPRVMRASELARSLSLAHCSTGESGACASPGKHSRAGHGRGGTGEPVPRIREQETTAHLSRGGVGTGVMPFSRPPHCHFQ